MSGEAASGAAHDDTVTWDGTDTAVDASNFTVTADQVGGGTRFVATGPCPGCGATVTSSRDEVDLHAPVTKLATKLDGTRAILRLDDKSWETPPLTKVQIVFDCDCPHRHKGHPDEKNPRGCGRRWSLTLRRSNT